MSATTTEYTNKLEQWYNGCPSPVQKVLNIGNAYKTLDHWLKYIAGDPEKLVSYGPKYVELATKLESIATEVTGATKAISGWEGESYEAFMTKTTDFSAKVSKAAKAIAGTQEILVACAKGCVQIANCIVDLVKMFVQWLIKSFLAALASSWCSFGATVAAWFGANIMKAIELLGKVTGICEKLSALVTKIVSLLKKVMELVQKIQKLIAVIKAVFAAFKAFKSGDILGGITSLAGAAQGYTSLTGGSSASATNSTLSEWSSTASKVAGAVKSGDIGSLVSSVTSSNTTSTLTTLWKNGGSTFVTESSNAWKAIEAARAAASKTS